MLISCPACGNSINPKIRFCPHCGAEQRRAVTESEPRCPRCGCLLDEEEYRGSEIDICPQCSGLWLDMDEFAFHTTERDTFADPAIPRTCSRPALPAKDAYLRCVRCRQLMVRRNFRRISNVLIDVCRDHGVWLDAGELEQIRCFIANGGLERSQDRTISRNREAIAKVAGETRDLKALVRILHKWDAKRILLDGF